MCRRWRTDVGLAVGHGLSSAPGPRPQACWCRQRSRFQTRSARLCDRDPDLLGRAPSRPPAEPEVMAAPARGSVGTPAKRTMSAPGRFSRNDGRIAATDQYSVTSRRCLQQAGTTPQDISTIRNGWADLQVAFKRPGIGVQPTHSASGPVSLADGTSPRRRWRRRTARVVWRRGWRRYRRRRS